MSGLLQIKWGINDANELQMAGINGMQKKKEEEDKGKKEKHL